MCYSAFQTGPAQISILGLSFIKNHVVVLDQGGPTLNVMPDASVLVDVMTFDTCRCV